MRLHTAARKFDNTVAKDAYSDAEFNCQFEILSYSKIDGVAVKKRQISTGPDVSVPKRRVVMIDGQYYLLGYGSPDYWKGSVIRFNYVIQGADALAHITSIAKALAGSLPVRAYAALVFAKYLPDTEDSSKYPPQYEIFLSGSEEAPADSLIKLDNVWYLVKQSYISNSGLRVALANALDAPNFENATLSTRTYNPVDDTYSAATTTIPVFRVKWSEHFRYLSKGTETYERGDLTVMVLKDHSPTSPDTLTLSDGVWRVLSAQDEGLVWNCHARRA